MADIEDIDLSEKIDILSELSSGLISVSPQEFLQTLPAKICSLLDVPVCILWQANHEKKEFQILATAGDLDDEYQKTTLDFEHPGTKNLFQKNKISFLVNTNQTQDRLNRFGDLEEINKRQFISIMSIPLKADNKKHGIIDIFAIDKYYLKKSYKAVLKIVASNAIIAFEILESLQEKEKIINDKIKLQDLTNTIHDMTAASETDEIWKLLRQGAEKLVNSKYIWLGRWNHIKGELELVEVSESPNSLKKLKFGQGVITQVIKNEQPIVISDIQNDRKRNIDYYVQSYNDTQSKIAIPLIDKVLVRENSEIDDLEKKKKLGSKIIGILNIESINANAFSQIDAKYLLSLARHTAISLERLEFNKKLFAIRAVEKEINEAKNYDEIIQIIVKAIK